MSSNEQPAAPTTVKEGMSTSSTEAVRRSSDKPSAEGKKKARRETAGPRSSTKRAIPTSKKTEKLVCRYCGSDDLSPSFIKRRDARCRACFKKRYGSAARSKRTASNQKQKSARRAR